MKYRVKKDLPSHRAGTDVDVRVSHWDNMHFNKDGIIQCSQEHLKELIADGFLEEIKPREFWVNVYNNYNAYVHLTKESAENISKSSCETIRVREVIEE